MPRKLYVGLAVILGGCASGVTVTAPAPEKRVCPAIAPSLPCSVAPAENPETLADLKAAWLTARKDAADCEALSAAWFYWWTECNEGDDDE